MTTTTQARKLVYIAHGRSFTRDEAVKLIYRHAHRDSKGKAGDTKTLLVARGEHGTCSVALDGLTDAEIDDRLPLAVKKQLPVFTTREARIVVAAITQVWQVIAHDAGDASNETAVELCIDADRLKTDGHPEADKLVTDAVALHGFASVRKALAKLVTLV